MQQQGAERRELWRQRISEQEASGQPIRAFCRERRSEGKHLLRLAEMSAPELGDIG